MDNAISKVSWDLLKKQAEHARERSDSPADESARLGPGSYTPFNEFGKKSQLSNKGTPRNFSFARSKKPRNLLSPQGQDSPPSTLYSPQFSLRETKAIVPKLQKGTYTRLVHLNELSKRSPGPVYGPPTLSFKSATFSKALRARSTEPTSQHPHFYPVDHCYAYLRNKPPIAFSTLKRQEFIDLKQINTAPFYAPASPSRRAPVAHFTVSGRSTILRKQVSPPVGLYSPAVPKKERSFIIPKAKKELCFSSRLYQGKDKLH